jgi:GTP-binding protein
MFVDRVTIYVKGGDGGAGMVSFHREKYAPLGGPDGGNGGDGGSVIVRAVAGADSLAGVTHKKHWRAENGRKGGVNNRTGRDGRDLVICVPPGTVVRDRDRGNILRDLTDAGQEVIVAKGGRRGRGNRHFATPTQRMPREAEPGEPGEERWLTLELKLIADAGIIGLPNAGKSTLLSRITRAHPEIADYPFTTKYPNLGAIYVGEDRMLILADLPGLIEGAHEGVGLGLEFLRHTERTNVLVHLVEPLPVDGSDPLNNYDVVRHELEQHSQELAAKPEIVCISKAELAGSDLVRRRLANKLKRPVLRISSVTGEGLEELIRAILKTLAEVKETVASKQA